jgi:hypothetical protein
LSRSTSVAMPTFFVSSIAWQQQRVGAVRALALRREVVGLAKEDRVDLLEVDEVLDLDQLGLTRAPLRPSPRA